MKYLILFLIPFISQAKPFTHTLKNGTAKYQITYVTKTVHAESKEVKGKIVCENECEFLLAISLKSFDSGDSNRDLNMQTTVEAGTYPVTTAKGKFNKELWGKKEFTIDALISFHGVEVKYPIKISDNGKKASFKLDLEKHKVDRPSLFAIKIDNDVLMEFNLDWAE